MPSEGLSMSRVLILCGLVLGLVSACLADTLVFKDGTKETVRIYKMTREYISYLADGRLHVIPREKIKDIDITDEPLTPEELAEALEQAREAAKEKLREEERRSKIKPAEGGVQSVTGDTKPKKGVKVISKEDSETGEVELQIDPFPDHPVEDKTPKRK